MIGRCALLLALTLIAPLATADWHFGPALPVTPPAQSKVFQHLESAGRKSIAVSAGIVAVVWEDNHSGTPQVYAAFKAPRAEAFTAPVRISTGANGYEPAIASAGAGRFIAAWEQDGHIWLREAGMEQLGGALRADARESAQVSLAAAPDGRVQAVWAQRAEHFMHIVTAAVHTRPALALGAVTAVDGTPARADQLYPSVALAGPGMTVAWEDRREGHTRLFYTASDGNGPFAAPAPLNELRHQRAGIGPGTGVTRVALAAGSNHLVAAAWMDKRDFLGGYDIYGAVSRDAGRRFGANEKVQDVFGNNIPQWHPAIAVHGQQITVAWDDNRDNTSDIWMSWRTAQGWSDDLAVPPASGPGDQTDPVLAFDGQGRLHVAWIARPSVNGPTRIWYAEADWNAQ